MTTREYYQKNKDKCKLKNKEYRQKNKEKERLRAKEYRKNHPDYFKEYNEIYNKKYYQKNKDFAKLKQKKYYRINEEYCKEYSKKYYQKHPEVNLKSNIKQLEKCAISFKLPREKYRWVLQSWSKTVRKRDNKTCQVCGSIHKLHSHHIFEKSKYPELSLNPNNGITLCIPCHQQAHGRLLRK